MAIRSFIRRQRVAGGAPGSRRALCTVLLALLFSALALGGHVSARPEDGTVVSGTADIVQSPDKVLDIVQSSDKAVIDWRSFSIAADEHTRFQQPSSSSMTLNRVTGGAYSSILGKLTANGRVLLINPNGILFGATASVDVNGLVATTSDIRNADFLAGRYSFGTASNPASTVVNRGGITAAEGGLVALVAPGVENSGVIRARLGRVTLASGNSFTLDLHGDNLIQIAVDDRVAKGLLAPDGASLDALAANSGTIRADGGTVVLLAASVAKDVVDYAVNMDGIVEARSAVKRNGRIVLQGTGDGIVRVAGTLDASGRTRGETGGSVKVLGEKVGVVGQARIDATGDAGGGEILVGGAFQGGGPERNARYTTIGDQAILLADALSKGDGGRVIVWSDRVTRFTGTINARGGQASGDGGFAEVSGKQHLQFDSDAIDLGAPAGATGELLLDPRDITISDANGDDNSNISSTDTAINFSDGTTNEDYNIQSSAFETINANVTLQAWRDITVSSPIDRSGASDSTLVLQAGRHITINAAITGTNGAHSLIIEADSPQSGTSYHDGTGTLTIGASGSLTSNNGDITLIAAAFAIDTTSGTVTAGTGDIWVAPSQTTATLTIGTDANDLSSAEIGRFSTSGTLRLGTATTGPTGTGGTGSAISAQDVTVSQALTFSSNAVLWASQDITVSAAISVTGSTSGTLALQAGRHVSVSAAITATNAAHKLILEADSPQASTSDGTGTLTINLSSTGSLTSNGGDITLIGAGFVINTTSSTVAAGTGDIWVAPSQTTATLTISSAALSSAEIAKFSTSGTVRLGTATTGQTGAGGAGSPISAQDVTISQALTFSSSAVLWASQDITVSAAISVTGSTSGTLALQAGRNITVDAAITASNAAHSLIIEADSPRVSTSNGTGKLAISATGSLTSNNAAITLIASAFDIHASSTVTAGTGDIWVAPSQTTVTLTIGSTDANDLGNAEIAKFSTSGTIRLGTATTGQTGAGGAGSPILAQAITVSEALAFSSSAVLWASQDITVSAAISLTGSTPSTLALQAGRNITVGAAITATNAAHKIILEADSPQASTSDGTGTLTINSSGSLTSNNGGITLIGAGFVIDTTTSTVTAGTGNIEVALSQATATLTIGTGTNDLSNAEIGRLTTSGTLRLGTATTGPTGTGGAGSAISAQAITVSEALAVGGSASLVLDSGGTTSLAKNVSTADGDITFSDPVSLTADVTVDSDSNDDSTDGDITFTSTINGGQTLTLDASSGAVNLQGAVGGTTALASLTVSGSQIDLGTVATTGAISVTGTNIDLNGATYESDDGDITFTGPVDLTVNVSVDSDADNDGTDGSIIFTSTTNAASAGGQYLFLYAGTDDVELRDTAGGTTRLKSLSVDGGQIDLDMVATTGAIDIEGTNIDLNAGSYSSQGGSIAFVGAVDLDHSAAVTVSSGSSGGDISFSSTVDAATAGTQSLTLDAGTGAVDLQGAVGATTKLASLTVDGGQIDLDTVATTGAIDIEGTNIDLNATTYESDDGNIKFTGPVDLHANVTVDSDKDGDSTDGSITFTSTINAATAGTQSLTLDADTGAVDLQGAVGGTRKLNNLTITGANITLAAVTLGGTLTLTLTPSGTITLKGNITVDDTAVSFSRPVVLGANVSIDTDADNDNTDGAITFTSTINGGHALTLDADTAAVDLQGAVGGTTRLASLTVDGGQIDLNTVATTGAIDIEGTNIDLNTGSYSTQGGNITFTGAVDLDHSSGVTVSSGSGGGNISFSSTINGARALTVTGGTGSVAFSGAVGGTTALTSLTVSGGQIDLNSVVTTGVISVTGTNIDLNGATYWSNDGNITFTGPVDLHTNVGMDSDRNGDGTDGDITFTSTINAATAGTQSLTLDADTGAVELRGAVGGTNKLNNLTITGANITLAAVAVGGTLTLTPSGTITLKGNIAVDDTAVSFSRPVVLGANVSIDTDADGDSTDGTITFISTINGGYALTLDADTGAVNLQGAVGGTTKLASLMVSGGQIDLNTVATTGAISITGTNIDLNGATYYSDDGNITFTGPVDLTVNVTVDSDANGDGTDGTITFTSTIDGAKTLALDADGGAVNLQGAVGGTTRLTSLTVDGGQIDLNSVATTGVIDIDGTNIDLNGTAYTSNDGNIDFRAAVDLHANVRVDSDENNNGTDGNIRFHSTVNGGQTLAVDADTGSVTFSGAVGGTTALTSLAVTGSGGISLSANVTTTGNIDFNSAVTLTSSGALTVSSGTGAGNIAFDSTVNGARALTVTAGTGSVTFSGAVGGTTRLASLTVNGGQIDLNTVATTGAISVTGTNIDLNAGSYTSQGGNIAFTGPVDLEHSSGVTVSSGSGGGNISFSSTVDGGRALTVTAGTGSVTFSGAVGGTTKLTSLTVSGGQIDLNTVATTGAISVTGTNIDLNGATYSSDDGNIRFTGPVDLHTNVTVDSDKDGDTTDGSITFTSTVDAASAGTQSLTLDADTGAVNLQGAVGGTRKLNNLTITGANINLAAVTLGGTLTLTPSGTITLKGNITVDDTAVSFSRPVVLAANVRIDTDGDNDNTDGAITFASTINGGYALTLDADTAAVDLQGAVGGTTRLTSLTIDGGQIDLNTVATTGAISVTGTNIDLNAGSYSTQGGNITFTGAVDLEHSSGVTVSSGSGGGNISFSSTINGARALTVTGGTGSVTFSGVVGGTTKLASLMVSGGQIDLNTVATTGAISITGTNIDLNGATYYSDDGNITFTGPVDLTVNVTVDSDANDDGTDGTIAFTSTINGGYALTLDADTGAVNLQGAVGGTTRLTSLMVDGGQIDLNSVATAGAISVTGTNIDLNGATYGSNNGAITFTGAVDLHANVRMDSDQNNDGTDGAITFTSTINGSYALTLDADTAAVNFQGALGGTTKLTSLTVSGGQIDLDTVATTGIISVTGTNIDLNGATYYSDDGNITFTGPVDLTVNVTVNSDQDNDGTDGTITFTSTINGAKTLTLDADGGVVGLQGAVGGTTKLTSLTVNGGQIDLNTVATTGAISVTGTNIDLNGATYESDDGNITFTGPVDLHASVTVDSDADNDTTDGAITFTGTINAATAGTQSLTLDASGGAVNLQGAVGNSARLASVTVDGGQIDLNSVATTGVIDIEGTNIDLNAGSYSSQGGNITFTGAVDLEHSSGVTVSSGSGGGNISFSSTVDGGRALTVTAGTGSVTFSGAIGGTTALTSLTVSGGQIDLNTVATTGAISVTGTNIDLNGATYESDNGNIRFAGPVDLHANVSVDSDANNDSTDGDITFTGTINAATAGTQSLTLDADTGAVNLQGAVGGTTKLASLTVNGGQIDLSTVATTGAISVTGTNIDLNGATYYSDDGNITFTGPVDLTVNVTVDSDANDDTTDGAITFTSTINGGYALTLDADTGAVNLQGAVGGTTRLASLTVDGGQIDLNSVATTGVIDIDGTNIDLNGTAYTSNDGNIDFRAAVDLHANVRVDSDENNNGTDGNIRFHSTVNGGQTLAVDADTGSVTFSGAVGGTTRLASLTVNGGQIDLNTVATTGAISVTGTNIDLNAGSYTSQGGNITFTGPVDLDHSAAVTVTSGSGGGDISFSSTVNGARALTVTGGTGSVTFSGAVGGTTALASLTVTGGQIDLSTVATTGAISVTGTNIDLNGPTYSSDDGNITFTGPVDLTVNVTVDSDANDDNTDGAITFASTINGGYALTLDADTGAVDLQGAVGGTTRLASLTVDGGQIDLNTVATTGAISVTGTNIDLNAGSYTSQGGNITFTGAVDLDHSAAVTVSSGSGGGDISFSSTVNGARALTVTGGTGSVTFFGAIGGTTKLTSLTVNGGQIDLNTVATTGAISVTGTNIDLNGATYWSNDGDITFTGPVDLHASVTVDSDKNGDGTDGDITFTSTINAATAGTQSLTLDADAGAVELRGAVGGTTRLASLTADGGQIDLNSVATTGVIDIDGTNIDLNGTAYTSNDGNIDFRAAVDLHANVRVDSDENNNGTDGNIRFHSTVNGGQTLAVDADTGSVTFSGAVGGTTRLASLTVNGGQIDLNTVATTGAISVTGTNIDLNAGSYTSQGGNITFTGAVDLDHSAAVTVSSGTGGGNIVFSSTINGPRSLTIEAGSGSVMLGGNVTLSGANALTVNGGGGITLGSGVTSVTTGGGAISFGDALALSGSAALTISSGTGGGNIAFAGTVNGPRSLTVTGGTGSVTFTGAVGGTTKLASLTVTGGQIDLNSVATTGAIDIDGSNIDLNGTAYTSNDGNIDFRAAVDLHANVRVDSDENNDATDGNIHFHSTVDAVTAGAQSLTLDAGSGAVDLQGAVGGTRKLASLTVSGGQIDLNTVAVAGAISVAGTNIDLNGVSYYSDDGNITFTGPVDLHADMTVDSDADDDNTDGNITFTSTIDGSHVLTLDADSGDITVTGVIGGTTKLTSLTTIGGTVTLSGLMTTNGFVLQANKIGLSGDYGTDNGAVTFDGAVTLNGAVTVTVESGAPDSSITFTSAVDAKTSGMQSLTLNAGSGTVDLQGAVGAVRKLASLTVSGGQVNLNTVATTGVISVAGTNIDLNGPTYSSDDGDITFTGPVDLHTGVTVDSDANDDAIDGNIVFTSTVNGAYSLVLDAGGAAVRLSGTVGGTTRLVSLKVNGGQIDLASVATTGAIGIEGTNIDLNGASYSSDDGNIRFAGPVDLHTSVTVDSDADNDSTDGNIVFTSTINGRHALVLDAGGAAVRLAGAVGATRKLTSLMVDAGQVDLASVATTGVIGIEGTNIDLNGATYSSDDGNIIFTGPVDLHADVTVDSDADNDSTDGDITFTGPVDAGTADPPSLTLDAGSGAVDLQGAVGATRRLVSLTVGAGQVDLNSVATIGAISVTGTNIDLNGASYSSDDGDITFTGAVDLHTDVTVDSDADNDATDGNIVFTSTLDGDHDLILNADDGDIDFNGDVGSTTPLGAVTVTRARNVTVVTSMNVESFRQTGGSGTTDFGYNTLRAVEFVEVSTRNIYGRIITKRALLQASNLILVNVEVGSLTIEAKEADITGTVDRVGGQGAADKTIINNRGPGPYDFNGYTILGSGAGTRTSAELAALPLLKGLEWRRHPPIFADAVFCSSTPGIAGLRDRCHQRTVPLDVWETSFPLLLPQPGTESYYGRLPGVIRGLWSHY